MDFYRMVDGYNQRNRAQGVYFRETYALLCNINRGESSPYVEPHDILLLPGEKKPRKPRPGAGEKIVKRTQQEILDIAQRINQQVHNG